MSQYFKWDFEGHGEVLVEYKHGQLDYEVVGPDGLTYFIEISIDDHGDVEIVAVTPAGY